MVANNTAVVIAGDFNAHLWHSRWSQIEGSVAQNQRDLFCNHLFVTSYSSSPSLLIMSSSTGPLVAL